MSAALNIQDYYKCYQCKAAADIYGRSCKHGMLFPIGLMLTNMMECPNYEFDEEKAKESMNKKERRKFRY